MPYDGTSHKKLEPMSDDDVKAIVGQEVRNSLGYLGGKLANDRQTAMDYFLAQPFGDEQEGLSQVVIPVVRDVILTMLPELMEMIASSDDAVEYEPTNQEDEENAKQATEYINYVFYKDNHGWRILHDYVMDGLLQKVGAVHVYTTEIKKTTVKTLTGLSMEEITQLDEGDENNKIEFLERTKNPDGTSDVKIRRTSNERRQVVENIPPEELIVSRYARDAKDPKLLGFRTFKTRSELIEMGYDRDLVMSLPSSDNSRLYYFQEEMARHAKDENYPQAGSRDETTREIEVCKLWIHIDQDGDGIAELREMFIAGLGSREGGLEILDNEEVDRHKISVWTPHRIPHVFHGLSEADLIMDVQLIQSTITRQLLDNVYGMNSGRVIVAESHSTDTTIDDLMVKRPDGLIRTKAPGGVELMQNVPIINEAIAALQYMDTVKEDRTGITKYNNGADANSLNKTATGINQIMGAARKRVVMVGRMLAETGLREIFRMLLHEVVTNQDKPRIIRLRNKWVPIDPRYWNSEMDVTINVGLGYGTKETQTQLCGQILGYQAEIIKMQGGAMGGLVGPEQIYNALADFVTSQGKKHPERYFAQPGTLPPAQPPPNKDMIRAQADTQIAEHQAQIDAGVAQHKAGLDLQKTIVTTQAQIAGDQKKHEMQHHSDMAGHTLKLIADIITTAMQPKPEPKPPAH